MSSPVKRSNCCACVIHKGSVSILIRVHMCAAVIADLQEWAPGKLLLYGGLGGDGKPLNDAWLLDLEHYSWELQYMGSSDLCPPTVSPSGCQSSLMRQAFVLR